MAGRDHRRVLVLDGDQPAALAIVRSLGRRGVTVDASERREGFLSSYSRFTHRSFKYPDPLNEPLAFVTWMRTHTEETHYDLVIPVAEDTVQPLAPARAELEEHTKLAIAPNEALDVMTDKAKTFALAASLGVPVPQSWTFSDEPDLERAAPSFSFPVVIKPSRSISARKDENDKARTKLSVMYAHDPGELVRLSRGALAAGAVIVQEYFRGSGVGVELLSDRGEVVYAFQHKRLHELPLTGGGSCLRESVPVNPMLLAHAKKLMAASKWHGVAMVEFKLNEETNECRLMEVNGRFWGSLPLAVHAGADFPYLLLDLLTENKRPDPSAPAARIGVITRKLSSDVYWYVQVLRPDQDEPLIEWPSKISAVKDLLLTLTPRHSFDVQSTGDPKPGFVDALRTGEWFVDRFREVARRRSIEKAQARERREGRVTRERLSTARHILFVCYGNINRSLLAEHHLRSLVPHATHLGITSAGFHEEAGRPPDPSMVREAARHGISFGAASSRRLDRAMLDAADLVLVMEIKHLMRLYAEYPHVRKKAFLLSSTTPSPEVPLEIQDPYGGDAPVFERCFHEIATCTRAIADALGRQDDRVR